MSALETARSESIDHLETHARKRRWLEDLVYADTDEAPDGPDGHAETAWDAPAANHGAEGAGAVKREDAVAGGVDGDDTVEARMMTRVAQLAEPGRRVRTLEDFTSTLLATQLHAATHALTPATLRTPLAPPLGPNDPPLQPDPAAMGYDGLGMAGPVRGYLDAKNPKRRPSSMSGHPVL